MVKCLELYHPSNVLRDLGRRREIHGKAYELSKYLKDIRVNEEENSGGVEVIMTWLRDTLLGLVSVRVLNDCNISISGMLPMRLDHPITEKLMKPQVSIN